MSNVGFIQRNPASLLYSCSMTCQTLSTLRAEATALRLRSQEQQVRLRTARYNERRASNRITSDLALFLQRKLMRKAQKIEEHISEHSCQN